MRESITRLGIVLLLAWLGGAATPALAESTATLDELAWLAGHWRSTAEGSVTEELWTTPEGGMMLGLNRQLRPGRRAAFEYLRIESTPEGIDYVASPGGETPTRFRLAHTGERSVAFHNPEHDWPQVLEYRLDEAGTLHLRAAGLDEGSHELAWTMQRADRP